MACPHGFDPNYCHRCRRNQRNVRYRARLKEASIIRYQTWTCGNCGKRHNTQADKICYYCFKPRGATR